MIDYIKKPLLFGLSKAYDIEEFYDIYDKEITKRYYNERQRYTKEKTIKKKIWCRQTFQDALLYDSVNRFLFTF